MLGIVTAAASSYQCLMIAIYAAALGGRAELQRYGTSQIGTKRAKSNCKEILLGTCPVDDSLSSVSAPYLTSRSSIVLLLPKAWIGLCT
jgi:hypothetical protein